MSEHDGLSEQPPTGSVPPVNPAFVRSSVKDADPVALARDLASGDRVALGRALSLVESTRPDHREAALTLLDACQAGAVESVRIGLSGPPGVGKSTLIDALGLAYVERGHRVAVLAVDPSSEISGGSILGDKTRMARLAARPEAFIRPSASGRTAGGVARSTRAAITVCEAAGYDVLLVETVGVGQSETAVRHMVDFFLLLLLAGAGDDLQGIKRGILEVADAITITKADGDNEPAAEDARLMLTRALGLFPSRDNGWVPRTSVCSARTGAGLDTLIDTVRAFRMQTRDAGHWRAARSRQAGRWLRDEFDARLTEWIDADPVLAAEREALASAVASQQLHPYRAAERLLALVPRRRP